jgi:hypothetical protein
MAARGRPRKNNGNLILKENSMLPKYKVVMRFVSNMNISNPATGEVSGAELEAVLAGYVEKGYHIFSTTYAGQNPNGYGVLFILERDE